MSNSPCLHVRPNESWEIGNYKGYKVGIRHAFFFDDFVNAILFLLSISTVSQ